MWSDGRTPRVRNALLNSPWLTVVAAVFVASFAIVADARPVLAVGGSTTVQALVRDDLPPTLSVLSPAGGTTVQDTTIIIEGIVHNVGQLMIYLDGEYYVTSPLDAGAETFSVTVATTVGSHTIKIVGLDPVTNTQIETSFTVTCTAPPTINEVVDGIVSQAGGVVIEAGKEIKSQVDQASGWGPMKALVDGSYNALRALDLIPTGTSESMPATLGRFALITTGITLTVAPWTVPYALSRLKLVPLHTVFSPHIMARLHVIGIAMLIFPFVFMT